MTNAHLSRNFRFGSQRNLDSPRFTIQYGHPLSQMWVSTTVAVAVRCQLVADVSPGSKVWHTPRWKLKKLKSKLLFCLTQIYTRASLRASETRAQHIENKHCITFANRVLASLSDSLCRKRAHLPAFCPRRLQFVTSWKHSAGSKRTVAHRGQKSRRRINSSELWVRLQFYLGVRRGNRLFRRSVLSRLPPCLHQCRHTKQNNTTHESPTVNHETRSRRHMMNHRSTGVIRFWFYFLTPRWSRLDLCFYYSMFGK